METSRDNAGKRDVDIATSIGDSTIIRKEGFAGGSIKIPSSSSLNTISFYGAQDIDETPVVLLDADGAAVTRTVVSDRIIQFPTECFGLPIVAMTGNAAETVTVTLIG